MEDTKIQWHPGFVAAMRLELREDREGLVFQEEYNLNTKPLEVDLLVIKKEPTAIISNEIGSFFRGHNIMEYKSPDDSLDITTRPAWMDFPIDPATGHRVDPATGIHYDPNTGDSVTESWGALE